MTSPAEFNTGGVPVLSGMTLVSVEFRLTPGYSADEARLQPAYNFAMDFATVCRRAENGGRIALVEVTIRPDTDSSRVPYTGKITACVSFDRMPDGMSVDDADTHAMNYGAPVAFSMIRDEFLRLSGMTSHNRLLLPLVPRHALLSGTTFRDVDGKILRQLKPTDPPPP